MAAGEHRGKFCYRDLPRGDCLLCIQTSKMSKGAGGGGRFVVAGRKVQKKTCQRAVIFVDTFLRCGKATVILWQGSSVGQSMRFIPAVSGVQIPPLLPKAIKKARNIFRAFFIAFGSSFFALIKIQLFVFL